jgi:acetoin:2,6-dichlorophenolindophenol oxidoreductase subunit alpha
MNDVSNQVARFFAMFRQMHLIRAFEHAAEVAWRDGLVSGSVHQYIGEEAIAVAVCANLRAADYIASYHRGHGHSIAKGADPARMMKELFGRADGVCGGKGGSMHIADFSVGMLGANGVVGDGATIAVGAAHAIRLRREDRIVVAFIGDGAMNRGPLMEALNWAQAFGLPILFVCEDNAYASTTRAANVTAGRPVERASSFGMPAEAVDGNDVLALEASAARLLGHVRAGKGPAFLHAATYRYCGHTTRDPGRYRDPEEVARFMQRDPIARCASWLLDHGVSLAELEAARLASEAAIAGAVADASAASWPVLEAGYADVQDLGAPR